jgi:DNA invertase Pin-like site-specific DNA recombinase
MNTAEWSRPTTRDEAQRRAAGRARYDERRQSAAVARRMAIANLTAMGNFRPYERGAKSALARQLGISRATATRDLQWLKKALNMHACPTCTTLITWERWHELERQGRVNLQ